MRKVFCFLAAFPFAFAMAANAQVTYSNNPQTYGHGQQADDNQVIVACSSSKHRLERCAVPPDWDGARMLQQLSNSDCVQGRSWGFQRGQIWVDEGCSARFAPGDYSGGNWRPGAGRNGDRNRDRNFEVSCGSPQQDYKFCRADIGSHGRVVLLRQLSNAKCIGGKTWGWKRDGIWVDKGCRGQFRVVRHR